MIVLAVVVAAVCAGAASGGWERLVSGGFDASGTEAARADAYAVSRFEAGTPHLTLLVRGHIPVDAPASVRAGRDLTGRLARAKGVVSVTSYWEGRDPALRSTGGREALVTAVLAGGEDQRVRTARRLVPGLTGEQDGLWVEVTGPARVGGEAVDRARDDLVRAELLTAPVVFLMLVFAFRSVLAALLPVLVAAVSSLIALALLRPLTAWVDVSTFAPNLTSALAFGLAVDYCLFLLARFRRERAAGLEQRAAVAATMRTAGRTVAFSVVTVALVMSSLFAFPLPFLNSMAWAGITVAVSSGIVCLLLTRAALLLAGDRLAAPRAPAGDGGWEAHAGWRRWARLVCRRPVAGLAAALIALTVMSVPLARLQAGPIDEQILPAQAPSRAAATSLTAAFPHLTPRTAVVVALPEAASASRAGAGTYGARLSRLPSVRTVDSATGRYQHGRRIAPASAPARFDRPGAGTWLAVQAGVDASSPAAGELVERIRGLPAPGGTVWVGGAAARFADTAHTLRTSAGPAAGWAMVCMAVVLLLFTRSVLVPVKAIVVGTLSLGASAGMAVLVFQDGFLAPLVGMDGRTRVVDACMLLLALCVAFALSMDYEMFLLSQIKEEHLHGADNREAVARGVERTGRLVTTAALALAVSVGALTMSSVTLLKLHGFALAFAVVLDATLVRAVLVPAAMCLTGRANWWAPARLHRLLTRWELHGTGTGTGTCISTSICHRRGPAVETDGGGADADRIPAPAERGTDHQPASGRRSIPRRGRHRP
ncbi:MMPL family transporter [Streptomyces ziwulingensis]|uniref:MMPL family transporter n=1 Tax=Streptomyces ziwulingensis TaxID=1045501 RepID=A0ABP9C5T1_9ACTN